MTHLTLKFDVIVVSKGRLEKLDIISHLHRWCEYRIHLKRRNIPKCRKRMKKRKEMINTARSGFLIFYTENPSEENRFTFHYSEVENEQNEPLDQWPRRFPGRNPGMFGWRLWRRRALTSARLDRQWVSWVSDLESIAWWPCPPTPAIQSANHPIVDTSSETKIIPLLTVLCVSLSASLFSLKRRRFLTLKNIIYL